MAGFRQERQQLGVLARPLQQVVGGQEPLARAREAAVALQTRPDECFVRQVVAGEERRNSLEEGGLGQRATGRQKAEDRPLHSVRKGCLGSRLVARIGEPPAAGLDLPKTPMTGPRELVANQGMQLLDLIELGDGGNVARCQPADVWRCCRRTGWLGPAEAVGPAPDAGRLIVTCSRRMALGRGSGVE